MKPLLVTLGLASFSFLFTGCLGGGGAYYSEDGYYDDGYYPRRTGVVVVGRGYDDHHYHGGRSEVNVRKTSVTRNVVNRKVNKKVVVKQGPAAKKVRKKKVQRLN